MLSTRSLSEDSESSKIRQMTNVKITLFWFLIFRLVLCRRKFSLWNHFNLRFDQVHTCLFFNECEQSINSSGNMNTESRKIVRRSFSNYVVSNLPREKLLKFNIQDDLRSKWPWLETLQATRFDFLIEKHTKAKSKNEPIDKKAMGKNRFFKVWMWIIKLIFLRPAL